MKKIAMLFVPVAAIGFAVPASAQTIVIRDGMHRNHDGMYRDRGYCARAEWRHRDRRDNGRRHHRGPAMVIQRQKPRLKQRPRKSGAVSVAAIASLENQTEKV